MGRHFFNGGLSSVNMLIPMALGLCQDFHAISNLLLLSHGAVNKLIFALFMISGYRLGALKRCH